MTLPPDDTAGKVNPEYAQGDLVRVLGVRNQIEGEFMQGLLLEEGVPSMLKCSMGFDKILKAIAKGDVLGSWCKKITELYRQNHSTKDDYKYVILLQ